ncbi:helix-turn-helix domain-containing protein [Caulobacter sp. LARHSG274]
MTPQSATFTDQGPTRRDDASTASVVADLIQAALGAAEARSFRRLDEGPADGEPDWDRDRRRPPSKGARLPTWRIRKIERFIAENLDRPLPLETLAPLVRLSCSHFARACKNTFGLTPRQLVLHHRIEQAQALMRDALTPLSQVALACGFADQAHFSRLFRQTVGTTPRQWRRDNLASSLNRRDAP